MINTLLSKKEKMLFTQGCCSIFAEALNGKYGYKLEVCLDSDLPLKDECENDEYSLEDMHSDYLNMS